MVSESWKKLDEMTKEVYRKKAKDAYNDYFKL